MGTYDGYWEMGEEREEAQTKMINEVEFWAIYDVYGNRVGNKNGTSNSAIRSFVLNHAPFGWNDFQAKGYTVKKVDVQRIKTKILHLQKQLS